MNQKPTSTPVEAGMVAVYYDKNSKVIIGYASFPKSGNLVTGFPFILAADDAALKLAIAAAGLIERK